MPGAAGTASGNQVRRDDTDELAGRDDLGLPPELWEMTLVAGDEIVGAGGVGAFEEDVVGGVGTDLKRLGGRDGVGAVLDELQELLPVSSADAELWAS